MRPLLSNVEAAEISWSTNKSTSTWKVPPPARSKVDTPLTRLQTTRHPHLFPEESDLSTAQGQHIIQYETAVHGD